jgi:hypothetical protein
MSIDRIHKARRWCIGAFAVGAGLCVGAAILFAARAPVIGDDDALAIHAELLDAYEAHDGARVTPRFDMECRLVEVHLDPKRSSTVGPEHTDFVQRGLAWYPETICGSTAMAWIDIRTRFGLRSVVETKCVDWWAKGYRVLARRRIRYDPSIKIPRLPPDHMLPRFYLPLIAVCVARDIAEWHEEARGCTLSLRLIPTRRWSSETTAFVLGRVNLRMYVRLDPIDRVFQSWMDCMSLVIREEEEFAKMDKEEVEDALDGLIAPPWRTMAAMYADTRVTPLTGRLYDEFVERSRYTPVVRWPEWRSEPQPSTKDQDKDDDRNVVEYNVYDTVRFRQLFAPQLELATWVTTIKVPRTGLQQ